MKKVSIPLFAGGAAQRWRTFSGVFTTVFTSVFASMFVSVGVQAATITVNSVADDVFINAAGLTFSDAAYTVPVSPAYCTLRMAISSANRDAITGGCIAGSASDTIAFSVPANSTITVAQVAMDTAPITFVPPATWLLFSTGNVSINGPGSALLTINGGGLGTAPIGLRTLVVSDNNGPNDAPATITGVSLKEGRSVGVSGGCVFSRESLTLTDVRFEGCEAVGAAPTSSVGGGALSMGITGAGDARPNATLSNVKFVGNRAVHGFAVAANPSCCGAASFGGGTLLMGSVNIADSQFIGNVGESIGALRIANGISAMLTNTQFISNAATAGNSGGFAIFNMSGPVTMTGGGAVGNSATGRRGGGSIITVGSAVSSGDAVTISDWSFIGNVAGADIGGLDILTDTFDVSGNCQFLQLRNVSMSNVYFEKNVAKQSRAGLRVGCSGNLALSNADFLGNEVVGDATAASGGNSAAQLHDLAAVTLSNLSITGNKTFAGTPNGGYGIFGVFGAATYPLTHSLSASNIRVRDNWAEKGFPGLWFQARGTGRSYEITNSSFTGNTSPFAPYGLFFETVGNYTVRNSTFSGNYSTGSGGTALGFNTLAPSGTVQALFENITSARNGGNSPAFDVAAFGGGPYSATITVRNSILGQYQYGIGPGPNFSTAAGLSYSFSNTIIENGGGVPAGICGTNGVLCGVDAKLEGLNYNGGPPGTFTHALRPGSPALDAGVAVAATTDQRGAPFARVIGSAVDIGAFESIALAAVAPCTLDMDGDNQVAPTKEGLVLIRAMLGFSSANAVIGTAISQSQWNATRNNLNANCGTNFAP